MDLQAFAMLSLWLLSWILFGVILWWVEGRPKPHCPACKTPGYTANFGRFRCSACGHSFTLGLTGRPARSLTMALVPALIAWIGLFAAWALLDFSRGEQSTGTPVFAFLILTPLGIYRAIHEKSFAQPPPPQPTLQ